MKHAPGNICESQVLNIELHQNVSKN